jgi:hypothetical protein
VWSVLCGSPEFPFAHPTDTLITLDTWQVWRWICGRNSLKLCSRIDARLRNSFTQASLIRASPPTLPAVVLHGTQPPQHPPGALPPPARARRDLRVPSPVPVRGCRRRRSGWRRDLQHHVNRPWVWFVERGPPLRELLEAHFCLPESRTEPGSERQRQLSVQYDTVCFNDRGAGNCAAQCPGP